MASFTVSCSCTGDHMPQNHMWAREREDIFIGKKKQVMSQINIVFVPITNTQYFGSSLVFSIGEVRFVREEMLQRWVFVCNQIWDLDVFSVVWSTWFIWRKASAREEIVLNAAVTSFLSAMVKWFSIDLSTTRRLNDYFPGVYGATRQLDTYSVNSPSSRLMHWYSG